ncbi:MAG: hypothetical protein PHD45_06235 [Bacteroidales bacterium]|nr:hypothetical protein [Bacteroidales bacterium]
MNTAKKTITFTILLILFMSFSFISCTNEDEITSNNTISQQTVKNIVIPDGIYIGYFFSNSGRKIEVKSIYKDNILIERWVDGEKQDLNLAPKSNLYWDENAAINRAMELSKSYPCVMLVAQSGLPQAESISYNVIFDSEEPCWYNQY